ncbi:MAG: class I SAM-dependent methyltransferase [Syntrophaceae bacterium]|nr:class I SAM-dependent methyltransferase [Syntrophaceae bacterium]
MERVPSACIVCACAERTRLVEKQGWTVYKCAGCGLGVLDPRPEPEELASLYDREYFKSHYTEKLPVDSPEMQRRLSQQSHRLRFFRPLKKEGLVVDIGCGMGYFLLAAKRAGYGVRGVDLSDWAASYITGELQIPVSIGPMDAIELGEGTVDVLTLWHSLEHMRHPLESLNRMAGWLKPEGLLVIEVPNHEGTDAVKMGAEWPDWDLPYHLYHFAPRSLRALLAATGFEVIREKTYLSEHVRRRLESLFVPGFLARLIATFYSGSGYAVIARRKD